MSRRPKAPASLPEQMPPVRSRYNRPRRPVSIWGIMIGLILGISAGLLYTWSINPRVEYDTEPWQLRPEDRAHYMVGITLAFAGDSNLDRALERLISLQGDYPQSDVFQQVADTACRLASTGYVDSNSGRNAIRTMMTFYQLQGRTGCADTLLPAINAEPTTVIQIDLPTPTLPPPATKTPMPDSLVIVPTPTPERIFVPTNVPQREFVLVNISTFCDEALSGIIEVFVQDYGGIGLPGHAVRVRWNNGESTFYTGLKPERGPAYADFQMEEGLAYLLEMPGRSDPSTEPLAAVPCTTPGGARAITSYRAVFLPAG